MTDADKVVTEAGPRAAIRFVTQGQRRRLAALVATAFLGGVCEALFLVTVTRSAFAITNGDDQVGVVAGRYLSVNQALLLALALVILRILFSGFAVWQSSRIVNLVVARVRHRLAAAFMRSAWEVQQGQNAGGFQELLLSYTGQAAFMLGSVTQGITAGANLLALLALAVAVDPVGALVMVVSVSLLSTTLRPLRSAIGRLSHRVVEANMTLATSVNEISQLGMELHVFHVQEQAEAKIEQAIESAHSRNRMLQFASGSTTTLYVGLAYLALVAALAVVSISASANLTTLGAVMLVMLRSLSYGQAVQTAYVGVSSSLPPVEVLIDQVNYFEARRRHDGGRPVGSVDTITVENLSFSYTDEDEVLHDLSLCIEPHEIIGVVGPSGSGKSTLVQLLLGLRDPQEGRILAGGRDIRSFDKAEWARKVTFVPQSAHLIAGTIADNIRFLRDGVDEASIERAARMAHLHDEIASFPEGYQRPVGEQGGHLSGGQQQRLCIARALVEQPDVLILDEPTSALDVQSEHLIRDTLLSLKDRMIVIIIAHRLSTLDICDRIMVIQDGELKGFDTPTNLEVSSDFYREALHLSGLR